MAKGSAVDNYRPISCLIINIALSSNVIGLKDQCIFYLLASYYVIGQFEIRPFVIGQSVMGQLDKPVTIRTLR